MQFNPRLTMKRLFFVSCLIFVVLSNLSSVYACEKVSGRIFFDALMNYDLNAANKTLQSPSVKNDPLYNFYEGVLLWAKSNEGQNKKLVQSALISLTTGIKSKHEIFNKNKPKAQLSIGLSQMLIARIYASRKQWILAYRNGKAARAKLKYLYRQFPNEKDALLGLGLFEYYTGTIPPSFKWLSQLMNFSGNVNDGLSLIHQSIKGSPVLAPEAARVLLNEATAHSNIKNACQYTEFNKKLRQQFPNNPQFSLSYQKLLNTCGYSQQALNENRNAIKQFSSFPNIVKNLNSQQLFILANLGEISEISKFKALTKQQLYERYLALGMANDIRNFRKEAIKNYRLAQANSIHSNLSDKTALYVRTPYKKPSKQPLTNQLQLASGCK